MIDGKRRLVATEFDGNYFFIACATCTACDAEHVLFDKHLHGWDGYVCRDPEKAALPRPPLTDWECEGCGERTHSAKVIFYTDGKTHFRSEAGRGFDADRWPDGFGWFDLFSKSSACELEIPYLASYESG